MKKIFLVILLLAVFKTVEAVPALLKPQGQPLVIELTDHLKHPFFWWPATLLSYPVQFDEPVKADDLSLTLDGKEVPFQLTKVQQENGFVKKAVLNFISDLPSGASKKFVLSSDGKRQTAGSGGAYRIEGVSVSKLGGSESISNVNGADVSMKTAGSIVISSDKLSVCIPASGAVSGRVTGPIQWISRNGKDRFGRSELELGRRKALRIETTQLESGPLLVSYRIKYFFDNDGVYEATVQLTAGYDFIEFSEKMTGLDYRDEVFFKFDWTGFAPTHRQAPNHPYQRDYMRVVDKTGIHRYEWETINQDKISGHHGVSVNDNAEGRMPFNLGVYDPWPASTRLSSAAFWDENTHNAAGIFIDKPEEWDDKLYTIWNSADVINVKYYYKDGLMSWRFPLLTGSRSCGIACYDHALNMETMDRVEAEAAPQVHPSGFTYRTDLHPYSYPTHLQSRYGTIHLNKVKDWLLTYPETSAMPPAVFHEARVKTPDEFERSFLYSGFIMAIPTSGPRQNNGFGPVPARSFYDEWVGAYNRYHKDMTSDQRRRITAMLLFSAYICAEEDFMPMRNLISGHPNFLADVKSVPALVAFLFPEHPEAGDWLDLFERYVALNLHYHTRPEVKAWNAAGGRWTENLGTYVWGFLKVTLRTATLDRDFGLRPKKNRVAYDNMATIGHWLKGSLSAPFNGEDIDFYRNEQGGLVAHCWGIVTPEMGPQRLHPPQGAHSARRMAPRILWLLGSSLFNYDPLLAENLMWISKPSDPEQEDLKNEKWNHIYPVENYNTGTMPEFRSQKFTGYGAILRAGVNTPNELSVHLQQIDNGHNYRWGDAGNGGCGTIYFYAAGKAYSHNGREDVGDRRAQDTDFGTNFGVFKHGAFRSIGQNGIERPLYDLGVGKFAELVSDSANTDVWPDYLSRSVMLVGEDYFITYDDLYTDLVSGRFSWYTHPNDDLPFIHLIRPNMRDERVSTRKTELVTKESKGVWYDGGGDFMFLISHKDGISVTPAGYGAVVKTKEGKTDYIFRNDQPVVCEEDGLIFNGTAGFIRTEGDNRELVLFHGAEIGYESFRLQVSHTNLGISAQLGQAGQATGQFDAPARGMLTIKTGLSKTDKWTVYVDGKAQKVTRQGNAITVELPAGRHIWQLTDGLPLPVAPSILYTENQKQAAVVYFTESPGATAYRIEYSTDRGQSWKTAGTSTKSGFLLQGLGQNTKIHIRVTACNKQYESPASVQYPVYLSDTKPNCPDGLKLKNESGKVSVEWGQVLGVKTYNLYRRKQGELNFVRVYAGETRRFTDTAAGLYNLYTGAVPENAIIYEYAVSAVNRIGESELSYPVTTDPQSWLNWNPKPDEKFRRTRFFIPGVTPYQEAYYPD